MDPKKPQQQQKPSAPNPKQQTQKPGQPSKNPAQKKQF